VTAGVETHGSGLLFAAVAVLLVAAKVGGVLAERWRQPPVLGELLVGIGLGNLLVPLVGAPAAEAVGHPTLTFLAEIGVLILLFDVGLEADLRALARVGPSAVLVAVLGVVTPIALGWAVAAWLLPEGPVLAHLFVGATLAATSVGITTRVLRDLGAMASREAQIILGAALLDDILGLVVLAVVSGMAAAGGAQAPSALSVLGILGRAALFLGVTIGLGRHLSGPIVRLAARTGHPESMLVFGLALCFALAYAAELLGLAPIVGAFAAGVMLDPYGTGVRTRAEDATLNELLHPVSALFVPLFFILIGMQVRLGSLTEPGALALATALVVAAVAGKLACALGVVSRGVDRLAVAIGMVPRGEVGLIFAGIGTTLRLDGRPLLGTEAFSAVVVMVLVTTLAAPVGLRWAFGRAQPTD
jgi:Kef-type K+ transport system membrane component KefB